MENTPKRDLKSGVALDDLPDGGIVLGNVEAEEVILVRRGEEFFAVGAQCTHYHGPLAEGLIDIGYATLDTPIGRLLAK